MPLFLLVARSSIGLIAIHLNKAVFARMSREPFIERQALSRFEMGVLKRVQIDIGSPMCREEPGIELYSNILVARSSGSKPMNLALDHFRFQMSF